MIRKIYHKLVDADLRNDLWHARNDESLPAYRGLFRELSWRFLPNRMLEPIIRHWTGGETSVWTFILGLNNSGTSLLEAVLASHPEIRSLPHEGQYVSRPFLAPEEVGISRLWSTRLDLFRRTEDDPPGLLPRARYDWASYFSDQNGHVVLVKTPADAIRAPWIQNYFEPVQFIALVRSPYAVAEGIRRRGGYTIREAAEHWRRANEILFTDIPSLGRVTWFRYEDFCSHPWKILERLQGFLDLGCQFPDDVGRDLDIHNVRGEKTDIRNFNDESIERLGATDIAVINEVAGQLMDELGYERIESK